MKHRLLLATTSALCLTVGAAVALHGAPAPAAAAQADAGRSGTRCAALASWSRGGIRITAATPHAAGLVVDIGRGAQSAPLPAHCEVSGMLAEHVGRDGQRYAIRFKMRLPDQWNRRFLFQGGGGTDGNVDEALGVIAEGQPLGISRGYAVITQDAGHSNTSNADPARGGMVAFGADPQARADYGHASLKASYDAARAIIAYVYGGDPVHSYFAGCSKGGQEGMAFAQRYPDAFDGILAAAPGFALPKAAIAEAWNTQQFAAIVRRAGEASVPIARLAESFSDADLRLARDAVVEACDARDGLRDGIVGAFAQCRTDAVLGRLRARVCHGDKAAGCLAPIQIDALAKAYAGPHDSRGRALYASFPWDAGLSDDGWRVWKIGLAAQGPRPMIPAINAAMGAPALATIFSTPPRLLAATPQAGMDYQLAYNVDRDAPAIFATAPGFARSAWSDIAARSEDLSAFRRHGAKMIVPHGGSDPVFSINDTIAWWSGVDRATGGKAASFVRVFPVPGMGHCSGGPATDRFDAFDALVAWVERGVAPDRIVARANPASPWPARTRPLCPYPKIARPRQPGHASERAEDFLCS